MHCCYCCSVTQPRPTLCHPMDCSMPGFPVHHQLLELAQTHVHWVSDAIQPSHPLLSSSPLAFPSIRVFSNESVPRIKWPKYWSFSISPFNEYLGLTSFRIDWFDLLAVQGTSQESTPTPQFKNINTTVQKHQFKEPVLSFLYGPTFTPIHDFWKNHSFH